MKVSQRKGMSLLAIKYTVGKDGVVKVIENNPPNAKSQGKEERNIGRIRNGQRKNGTPRECS
jgi:hypothetical protein